MTATLVLLIFLCIIFILFTKWLSRVLARLENEITRLKKANSELAIRILALEPSKDKSKED